MEIEEIKKQILKLEFQHKKDIAEVEKRNAEADKRFNEWFERMEKMQAQTQAHLTHITKLTGIAFDNFADIESRMENAANALQPQAESK